MGTRERVIKQTIIVCDLCKKEVKPGSAKTGTIVLRSAGQRGRAPTFDLAFHGDCAGKITDTAVRPKSPKKRATTKSPATKPAAAKPPKAVATKRAARAPRKAAKRTTRRPGVASRAKKA